MEVTEIFYLIILPIIGVVVGYLLMRRPDIITDYEVLGTTLFRSKRFVKVIGVVFTFGSIIFLVAGIFEVYK